MFLSFRGYLSEIESGAEKNSDFFMRFFFFCMCSVVLGPMHPLFKPCRKSGGAASRALGNIVLFLTGPARIRTYKVIVCVACNKCVVGHYPLLGVKTS